MLPSLDDYLHATNLRYCLFLPEILMMRESCNLIGRGTWPQPTKVIASDTNFLWWPSTCKISKTSIDSFQRYWWYKNPAIWLDERLSLIGHTQPNEVVPGATFPWWLPPGRKSKRSIYCFQRYWWSKNPEIWLVQEFLTTTEEPGFEEHATFTES